MKGLPIQVADVTYPSFRQACVHYKLPTSTVRRIAENNNMSHAEVLDHYAQQGSLPTMAKELNKAKKMIAAKGKMFHNTSELCQHFGLVETTARQLKRHKELTWDQVIDHYQNKNAPKEPHLHIKGQSFFTLKEACHYFGYSYSAVNSASYIDEIPPLHALQGYIEGTYPLTHQPTRIGRVTYPSLRVACKTFSVKREHILKYMEKYDVDISEALTDLVTNTFETDWVHTLELFKAAGVATKKVLTFYLKAGINPSLLWTFYEKERYIPNISEDEIYVQYHRFPSILIACIYFGLNVAQVYNLARPETCSVNGVFTHLLKEKCE